MQLGLYRVAKAQRYLSCVAKLAIDEVIKTGRLPLLLLASYLKNRVVTACNTSSPRERHWHSPRNRDIARYSQRALFTYRSIVLR